MPRKQSVHDFFAEEHKSPSPDKKKSILSTKVEALYTPFDEKKSNDQSAAASASPSPQTQKRSSFSFGASRPSLLGSRRESSSSPSAPKSPSRSSISRKSDLYASDIGLGDVVLEGLLEKKSGTIVKGWQKKRFKLLKTALLQSDQRAWFPMQADTVFIRDIVKIDSQLKDPKTFSHTDIAGKTTTYRANDPEEAKKWCTSMQECLDASLAAAANGFAAQEQAKEKRKSADLSVDKRRSIEALAEDAGLAPLEVQQRSQKELAQAVVNKSATDVADLKAEMARLPPGSARVEEITSELSKLEKQKQSAEKLLKDKELGKEDKVVIEERRRSVQMIAGQAVQERAILKAEMEGWPAGSARRDELSQQIAALDQHQQAAMKVVENLGDAGASDARHKTSHGVHDAGVSSGQGQDTASTLLGHHENDQDAEEIQKEWAKHWPETSETTPEADSALLGHLDPKDIQFERKPEEMLGHLDPKDIQFESKPGPTAEPRDRFYTAAEPRERFYTAEPVRRNSGIIKDLIGQHIVKVTVKFAIEKLDFAMLDHIVKQDLTDGIKKSLATSTGVPEDLISVNLSPGSVVVDAEISTPKGRSAELISSTLSKTEFADEILHVAKGVDGIQKAAMGEIFVSAPEVVLQPSRSSASPLGPKQNVTGRSAVDLVLSRRQRLESIQKWADGAQAATSELMSLTKAVLSQIQADDDSEKQYQSTCRSIRDEMMRVQWMAPSRKKRIGRDVSLIKQQSQSNLDASDPPPE